MTEVGALPNIYGMGLVIEIAMATRIGRNQLPLEGLVGKEMDNPQRVPDHHQSLFFVSWRKSFIVVCYDHCLRDQVRSSIGSPCMLLLAAR